MLFRFMNAFSQGRRLTRKALARWPSSIALNTVFSNRNLHAILTVALYALLIDTNACSSMNAGQRHSLRPHYIWRSDKYSWYAWCCSVVQPSSVCPVASYYAKVGGEAPIALLPRLHHHDGLPGCVERV